MVICDEINVGNQNELSVCHMLWSTWRQLVQYVHETQTVKSTNSGPILAFQDILRAYLGPVSNNFQLFPFEMRRVGQTWTADYRVPQLFDSPIRKIVPRISSHDLPCHWLTDFPVALPDSPFEHNCIFLNFHFRSFCIHIECILSTHGQE